MCEFFFSQSFFNAAVPGVVQGICPRAALSACRLDKCKHIHITYSNVHVQYIQATEGRSVLYWKH